METKRKKDLVYRLLNNFQVKKVVIGKCIKYIESITYQNFWDLACGMRPEIHIH